MKDIYDEVVRLEVACKALDGLMTDCIHLFFSYLEKGKAPPKQMFKSMIETLMYKHKKTMTDEMFHQDTAAASLQVAYERCYWLKEHLENDARTMENWTQKLLTISSNLKKPKARK